MNRKELLLQVICALLIVLFSYAAVSKLMDYDKSQYQMRSQIFTMPVADVLTWVVPTVELLICACLLFIKSRFLGFCASFLLLIAFTAYIILAMSGYFGPIPCSCGGILEKMSYQLHIAFNLFFAVLAGLGILTSMNNRLIYKRFKLKKGGHAF